MIRVQLDEQGHLVPPPDLMERFGFVDGAAVRVEERGLSGAQLKRVIGVLLFVIAAKMALDLIT